MGFILDKVSYIRYSLSSEWMKQTLFKGKKCTRKSHLAFMKTTTTRDAWCRERRRRKQRRFGRYIISWKSKTWQKTTDKSLSHSMKHNHKTHYSSRPARKRVFLLNWNRRPDTMRPWTLFLARKWGGKWCNPSAKKARPQTAYPEKGAVFLCAEQTGSLCWQAEKDGYIYQPAVRSQACGATVKREIGLITWQPIKTGIIWVYE